MPLSSSPELPFYLRFNLGCIFACSLLDWLVWALGGVLWYRLPPSAGSSGGSGVSAGHSWLDGHAWLALQCALTLANIVWRRCCRGAPAGGSHARWREALCAVIILNSFGFGKACLMAKTFVEEADIELGAASSGTCVLVASLRLAILLLLASGMPSMVLGWSKPKRVSLAIPLHLLVTLQYAQYNSDICSARGLASPMAQRLTHRAFRLLGMLRYSLYPAPPAEPLSGTTECSILMTYLQLGLGFLVPALVQAVLESRLFMAHQQQRRQQGLQPETGWQARLYETIDDLRYMVDWPTTLLIMWMLSGILWDTSVLLRSGSGVGGAPPRPGTA